VGVDFVPTYRKDTYNYINPAKLNLSDKHVLITGASKGIGRSTALAYARAGAAVIVLAARSDVSDVERDVLKAAQQAGKTAAKITCLKLDVTSKKSVENAAIQVKDAVGYIDYLINNAGAFEKAVPMVESDPDSQALHLDLN